MDPLVDVTISAPIDPPAGAVRPPAVKTAFLARTSNSTASITSIRTESRASAPPRSGSVARAIKAGGYRPGRAARETLGGSRTAGALAPDPP